MSEDDQDKIQDDVPEKYRQVRPEVAGAGVLPNQPIRCFDKRDRKAVFGSNGDGRALNTDIDPFTGR